MGMKGAESGIQTGTPTMKVERDTAPPCDTVFEHTDGTMRVCTRGNGHYGSHGIKVVVVAAEGEGRCN